MTTPDSLDAIQQRLERSQARITAAYEALQLVSAQKQARGEPSRTATHLLSVLLRVIEQEESITRGDPLETARWVAQLPLGERGPREAPDVRAGWYLNPRTRGCPPINVLEVLSGEQWLEYHLEGEHPNDFITVSTTTFAVLLQAGYEHTKRPAEPVTTGPSRRAAPRASPSRRG